MSACKAYGGHPDLSCLKNGPIMRQPCEPCQLTHLRELMPKAQKIILDLSDGDVANYVEHGGDCPGDDTCDPSVCKDIAAMNAVMRWEKQ